MPIESLEKPQIEEAVRLSSAVGWNQTQQDWLRLVELNPRGCFVYRRNSRVVGTVTLAAFWPSVAWIGMLIVDPNYQRQGLGKKLFEYAVHVARQSGFKTIGLDASAQGHPLYRDFGFVEVQGIDRWAGRLQAAGSSQGVQTFDENALRQAVELDRQWSGCDRSPLIRRLCEEESNRPLALWKDDSLRGFAMIRPGREFYHVGPLVGRSMHDFGILLDAAAKVLKDEPVVVDALRREASAILLRQRGLEIQRNLTRMTFGERRPVLCDSRLHLAVAFEWG